MSEASPLTIATWNVNSIRAREERVLEWMTRVQPDILCLQELKVEEKDFPFEAIRDRGYTAHVHAQRTYNGVAIITRESAADVAHGMRDGGDDHAARLIEARISEIRVICCYFPNGQQVGSDKYFYKLEWIQRLVSFLGATGSPDGDIVVCGDFNVAPDDKDVARPEEWGQSVLCHTEARAALRRLSDWGLVDVVRRHHPNGGVYSWWDYRMLGFPKGNGLRIDHIFATQSLAQRCTSARIDRDARKGKKPSDHAPVLATFTRE